MSQLQVMYRMSSVSDGSMSKAVTDNHRQINQEVFLQSSGVRIGQAVLVKLEYNSDNFCRYLTASVSQAGDGMTRASSVVADALFTTEGDLALFLPIADCVAAVLHDVSNNVLGLAHLGRHNLEQAGGKKVIEYMVDQFLSKPADITVWLSPAAGKLNYPLFSFDNRSLHDVAIEQLQSAGIAVANIQVDARDTTTDDTLFSHSEFLKGNRQTDGRQAVVCMLRS